MRKQETLTLLISLINEAKDGTLTWLLAASLGYTSHENALLNGYKHKGVWLSPPPPGDPNKWIELSSLSVQDLCDKHSTWDLIAGHRINLQCVDGKSEWVASTNQVYASGNRPEEAFARCFVKLKLADDAALRLVSAISAHTAMSIEDKADSARPTPKPPRP